MSKANEGAYSTSFVVICLVISGIIAAQLCRLFPQLFLLWGYLTIIVVAFCGIYWKDRKGGG